MTSLSLYPKCLHRCCFQVDMRGCHRRLVWWRLISHTRLWAMFWMTAEKGLRLLGSEGRRSMSRWGSGRPGSLRGGGMLAILCGTFEVPHVLNNCDQMGEGHLALCIEGRASFRRARPGDTGASC